MRTTAKPIGTSARPVPLHGPGQSFWQLGSRGCSIGRPEFVPGRRGLGDEVDPPFESDAEERLAVAGAVAEVPEGSVRTVGFPSSSTARSRAPRRVRRRQSSSGDRCPRTASAQLHRAPLVGQPASARLGAIRHPQRGGGCAAGLREEERRSRPTWPPSPDTTIEGVVVPTFTIRSDPSVVPSVFQRETPCGHGRRRARSPTSRSYVSSRACQLRTIRMTRRDLRAGRRSPRVPSRRCPSRKSSVMPVSTMNPRIASQRGTRAIGQVARAFPVAGPEH